MNFPTCEYIVPTDEMRVWVKTIPYIEGYGRTGFRLGRDHVYGVRDLSFPIPRERYILPNGEEAINRGRAKAGPYPRQLVEQQGYDREDGTGSIGRRGRDD